MKLYRHFRQRGWHFQNLSVLQRSTLHICLHMLIYKWNELKHSIGQKGKTGNCCCYYKILTVKWKNLEETKQTSESQKGMAGMLKLSEQEFFASGIWTVLRKTLESILDCKNIKPDNPKWNQPLLFIGRTDAEAEAPRLWPPDAKSQLIGKAPDAEKDWGQEQKGVTGWDSWMASPTQMTWVWANSGKQWGQGSPVCCSQWGRKKSDVT